MDIAVLCDGINDCGDSDPGSDEVEAVCSMFYHNVIIETDRCEA